MKTVLFQAIQFNLSTQFSSILQIDRNSWRASTLGHSGLGSNGDEGAPHIPQSSSITGTSPLDCLISYPGFSLVEGLKRLKRCSRSFLQPQPAGQNAL